MAQTLPSGGAVASGSATISTSGSTLTIDQSSAKAIINWQNFSVGRGDRVVVNQPDASAALLSRVTGGTTSVIAGQISANGQFFLINPNGIFITPTGVVNAGGGFVASTLALSDDDFKAGRLHFSGGGRSAGVSNQGVITIGRGGYAALIGGTVTNSGLIAVPMGKVALGSGEAATLDLSGDGFLQVAIPTLSGDGSQALIQSSGWITADGGLVVMNAATARAAARQAINISGDVEAHSISGHSGAVVLGGGPGGGIDLSGHISVAGGADATGGSIAVTGQTIGLTNANIDASGGTGGGSIKIGGDARSAGPMLQADAISMDAASTVRADATGSGDGGKIVLWSTGATSAFGGISARGGANGGDGGAIETSGHTLDFTGAVVDASAASGKAGSWLLDPFNLTIDSTAAATISSNLSSGTNVTLTTTASAASSSPSGIGTSSSGSGDIIVNSAIAWGSDATLALSAYHSIAINAGITISGAGGLSLTTNNGGSGGTLTFGSGIGTPGSVSFTSAGTSGRSLSINGTSYQLIDDMTQLAAINGSTGAYALAQSLTSTNTYSSAVIASFGGTFEGLGNTISNLTISNSSGNAYLGLFGQLNSGGVIRDIGLTGGSITGSGSQGYVIGDLVGLNYGAILQSYATGNVTITAADAGDYIGGLVGGNQYGGTITASYATGNVGDNNNGVAGGQIGGLVGMNSGAIAQSFATGWVSNKDNSSGGLVGFNYSGSGSQIATITNSYATGAVTSPTGNGSGGLVGTNGGGVISNSFATGTVSSSSSGGLVAANTTGGTGTSTGTITNSYWDTTNSGISSGSNGTGQTTSQMQTTSFATTLGSAFGGGSGLYPYLLSINPNGVQVIGGTVFKGAAVNPVTTSSSGAGTAALFVNGVAFGSASTNSSGVYRFQAPAGTVSTGTSLLAVATQNSTTGEVNGGNLNTTGATGMDIYGGYFYDNTSQTSYSASNVATVLGYTSTPSALSSLPMIINASGASYSFDTALTLSKTLTLNINSGEPVTVSAPITLTGSNSLTLGTTSGGALNINALIAVTGTGTVNLNAGTTTYTSSGGYSVTPVNMAFGSNGSVQFQDNGLGALNVNGSSYTLISTMAQLANINTAGLSGRYALAMPLTASSTYTSALIGSSSSPFTGTFEGLGNSITGLTINAGSTNYVGLFGEVSGASAVVRDLRLVGGSVSGQQTVGFLVGYSNQGLIFQDSVTGSVTASADSVGGLIGTSSGFVVSSSATGAVSGDGATGGLVGHSSLYGGAEYGLITNSYATGAITGLSGSSNIGGLVGASEIAITNSYATGIVSASSSNNVGGLVGATTYGSGNSAGSNPAPITNSYATGSVTGKSYVGGLVGNNASTDVISWATASGNVTSTATNGTAIGGLVGSNAGAIQYASASGAVAMSGTASNNFAGGLVGDLLGSITKSYATGAVTGGYAVNVGGLVGRSEGTGTITQSFATGAVTSGGSSGTGGLVGNNYGSITQSYAQGSVTATAGGGNIGGIAGQVQTNATITYSYATGALTAGGGTSGGIYGALAGGTTTLTGNYWDTSTTGTSAAQTGSTGLTTSALQGSGSAALTGLNGGGTVFSSGTGLYPYLQPIYTNGVQVVSGFAYKDAGQTLLTPNSSGAGLVSLNIGGTAEGSVSVGNNGYYYFLLAPNTFASGATVVPYTAANAAIGQSNGAAIATATGTSVTGLNIYGGYLNYSTTATNYSSALTTFTSAQNTLASYLGGPTLSSTLSPYITATGASFTIDQTPLVNSLAVQTTTANAGITVAAAAPIAISGSNALTLNSIGTLVVDAPITVKGAGTVNLSYNTAAATNLSFGIGDSLVYQTAGGAAATSSQGGALSINGQAYSLVYSSTQLDAIDGVNAASNDSAVTVYGSGLTGRYALATPLTLTGTTYTDALIGTGTAAQFTGIFEGLGNTITGLSIAKTTATGNDAGLFGYVGSSGVVRDLGLIAATGSGVLASGSGGSNIGALVGRNDGSVIQSYSTIPVTMTVTGGTDLAGGLVGDNFGTITASYATGAVSGSANSNTGGLVGRAESFGSGTNTGAISLSYATGAVSGGANASIGGLAGIIYNFASITNSYAMGAVTGGTGANVGGLIGQVYPNISVTKSYATGQVTVSSGTNVGGFYGLLNSGNQTFSNNYWDTATSGSSATQTGATGLATASMQGNGSTALTGLGTVFAAGTGLYPYLTALNPTGVQAVSGIAYKDSGATILTSGTAGAGLVSLLVGGASQGSATTGANGYYYIAMPSGTISGSGSVVTPYTSYSAATGAQNGATLLTAAGTTTGLNVYGGYLSYTTSATTYSSAITDFTTSQAALASYLGSTSVSSTLSPYITATGASFTVDQAPSASSLAVQTTATNAGITVAAPITISGTNSLTLKSVGALTFNAPVAVNGAGTVNLAYNTAAATNLSFGIGDSLAYQTAAGGTATSSQGGSLTINGQAYTLVYTPAQLDAIDGINAASNNAAVTIYGSGLTGNYALATPLTLTGTTYTDALIGTGSAAQFTGIFEGVGNAVTGLSITKVTTNGNGAGLFGYLGSAGVIRDLALIGVPGSTVSGSGSGGDNVGSLVAINAGTIVQSSSSVAVSLSSTGTLNHVGDLVGDNSGTLLRVSATGAVNLQYGGLAGGLAGMNESSGSIGQSFATGAVTSAGFSGYGFADGGFVGANLGVITQSYATGAVSTHTSNGYVGGFAGEAVSGAITYTYATGAVSSSSGSVNGFLGYNGGGSYSNNYWDTTTSGTSTGQGASGLATSSIQGAGSSVLSGLNGGGTVFASGTGLYPYLQTIYANGVQAVSGIAYQGAGSSTPLASNASGTGIVSLASGGTSLVSATTGANGYYYLAVPTGTLAAGQGLAVYTAAANGAGAANAASFTQSASGASGVAASNLNIYGGWLTQQTGSALTTLSGLNSAYATAIGSTAPAAFTLANRDITVDGSSFAVDAATTLAGTLSISSPVAVTQSAALNVGSLLLSGTGSYSLTNTGNQIGTLAANAGALSLADAASLSIGTISNALNSSTSGLTSTGAVNLAIAGGLTLNAAVTAGAGGDAKLSAIGAFTNNAGASAVVTSAGGRWLIYSATSTGDTFGGLDSTNTAIWGTAAGTSVTATGNRYVFAYQPSLTVTTLNGSKTYGADLSSALQSSSYYTVTGQSGVANAYLGDTTGLYTGAPSISSSGASALANVQAGGYAINASIGSLTATASGYSATPTFVNAGVLTINPLAVTLGGSQVYNGTTSIASSNLTLTNGVGGATASSIGLTGSGSVTSPNVSAGSQALTLTGLSLTNPNYTVTGGSGTVTIAPLAVTLGGSQVYNGTTTALGTNLAVTNLVSGDSVSVGGTGTLAAKDVVPGGSQALTSLAGLTLDNANYTLTGGSGTLTITPAALAIVANSQSATYGTPYTLTGYSATGLQGSDAITGLSQSVTIGGQALGATTAHSAAGSYAITPSAVQGITTANYTISYGTSGTLTIAPLAVTLGGSQVYNGTTTALGTNLAVTNLVSGDSVSVGGTGTLAAKDVVPGGSQALASLAGLTLDNANYTLTGGSGTLTITPAALAIVANSQSATYGTPYTLTGYSATGLQGSDAITGLSQSVTIGGQALGATTTHSAAGSYAITPSAVQGITTANYTISYGTSGTLTIAPLAVTLGGSQVYNGTTTALGTNLAVTNLVSGDSVSVGGTGTLAAKDVVPGGSQALASLAGLTLDNANYTLTGGSGTLTITPAALAIVANSQSATYGTPYTLTGYSATGLQGSDAITGLSQSVTIGGQALGATTTHSAAGSYAITPSAVQGITTANYTISYGTSGTLTIAPLAVTLGGSQVYNGTTTALGTNLAVTNLVSGDSVSVGGTGTLAAKDVVPGGSQALTSLAGLTLDNANYTLTGGSGTLTITPAALAIVANSQSATYGTPYTLTGYSATGLQGSDAITGLSQSVTIGGQALGATTAHSAAGSYAITPSAVQGITTANYTISYGTSGTLTIAPLAVTLGGSQVYNGTTTALGTNLAVTNLVSGDSVSVGGTGTLAAKDVVPGGSQALASLAGLTLDNANYTLTGGSGTLTITPAALAIVANSQSATYGTPYTLTGYSATGLQGSDAITGLSQSVTIGGQALGATTAHSAAGSYAITPSAVQGITTANYTISYGTSGTLTIAPLAVTLGGSQVYNGTTTALGTNLAVTNLVSGDSVSVGGTGTLAAKDVVPGGSQALTSLAGLTLDNANYTLTGGSGTLTITPAQIIVAGANGVDKTFDGTNALPNGATGFVYSGILNSDAVTINAGSASYASASVGPQAVNVSGLMLSGPAAINYALNSTTVVGSGTIQSSASTPSNPAVTAPTFGSPNTANAGAVASGNTNTLGDIGAPSSGPGSNSPATPGVGNAANAASAGAAVSGSNDSENSGGGSGGAGSTAGAGGGASSAAVSGSTGGGSGATGATTAGGAGSPAGAGGGASNATGSGSVGGSGATGTTMAGATGATAAGGAGSPAGAGGGASNATGSGSAGGSSGATGTTTASRTGSTVSASGGTSSAGGSGSASGGSSETATAIAGGASGGSGASATAVTSHVVSNSPGETSDAATGTAAGKQVLVSDGATGAGAGSSVASVNGDNTADTGAKTNSGDSSGSEGKTQDNKTGCVGSRDNQRCKRSGKKMAATVKLVPAHAAAQPAEMHSITGRNAHDAEQDQTTSATKFLPKVITVSQR